VRSVRSPSRVLRARDRGHAALQRAGAYAPPLREEEEARVRAERGANAARALEHVSDAVLLVDDAGTVRSWNNAAERLFGVAPELAVGTPAEDVVPDYSRLVESASDIETLVPVAVGDEERWLAAAVSRFEGGSVLTIRDATAAHLLERARVDFVATASHELRTPLTAIYGGVRTLLGGATARRSSADAHAADDRAGVDRSFRRSSTSC